LIPVRALELLVSSGVITAKMPGSITPKGDNGRMREPQTRDDVESVDTRNIQIENGEVGQLLPGHFDRCLAVLCLHHDAHAEQLHKMSFDDPAKCGVIVYDQNSGHFVAPNDIRTG
jgi:hypothetical protein